MQFQVGDQYKTRAELTIIVLKLTPKCKYKMVGYFQIRNIRIRVFYTENGNEFFGEKGLDLTNIMWRPEPYLIGKDKIIV